ncbi:MAG: radical SAM protein, partial [Candidatus Cloacimonetes bacterium]|nr:radical SAM protein [Candidatus Cloacimonadota bacterium]
FQDDTSTAGEPGFLKRKFSEALSHPEVVGLIVSTRPDYINKEIVELLRSFNVPVSIEIGMQTIHEKSLEFLQRGHNFIEVENAVKLCGENGLNVGVHLIMGIPGENFEDMLQTIKYISSNKYIKQVKFHNLVVYKNTKLAEMLKENGLSLITIDEYIEILAELFPYIRGDIVVSRLFTSNIRRSQIAIENYPGNKTKWMNALRIYLYKKNIIQGMETDKVYKLEKYI